MIVLPIPGFERYFASSEGDILSDCSRGPGKSKKPLNKLKTSIQSNGKYFTVNIKNDKGLYKTHRVHRLVCLAFHGKPPENNFTASHLDGNWKNNKPENLKWESYSDNLNRKKEHGTDDVGINNSRALLNLKQIKDMKKLLKEGKLTHEQIGHKFKVSRVFVTKVANGHRYAGQGNNQ